MDYSEIDFKQIEELNNLYYEQINYLNEEIEKRKKELKNYKCNLIKFLGTTSKNI